jgi:hypothetical protein
MQLVDRHALRVRRQRRQRVQQLDAVGERLAEADDAAAAHLQARRAHVLERVEPVRVGPRADDLRVMARGGVEVVVVVVEPRLLERAGLRCGQHAERRAGLEAEPPHLPDDSGELSDLARLRAAPRRAHAEARRATRPRRAGTLEHVLDVEHLLAADAGLVAHALRAVRAILGAAAGLHADERAHLDHVRVEMLAVHGMRPEEQVVEWQPGERPHLVEGPVGARGGCGHGGIPGVRRGFAAGHGGRRPGRLGSIETAPSAVNRCP